MKSFFLVVDGPDGVGKSSVIDSIKNDPYCTKLIDEHFTGLTTVKFPGEPNGSIGARIREIILSDDIKLEPMVELNLLLADMRQTYFDVVKPALDKGHFVIADRYVSSTYVYQILGNTMSDIKSLGNMASIIEKMIPKELLPNKFLIFNHLSAHAIINRLKQREINRLDTLEEFKLSNRMDAFEMFLPNFINNVYFNDDCIDLLSQSILDKICKKELIKKETMSSEQIARLITKHYVDRFSIGTA